MESIEKEEFLKGFGIRVRQARTACNMTLEELANRLGYTSENARSTVQKIESGKSDLGASKTYAIAKVLGVSVSYLMGMEDNNAEVIQGTKACEMFEECHEEEISKVVNMYLKLDHDDRVKIVERMECLLEDEKYSAKEESGSG